jgi:hypothetical protein
MSRAGKNEDQTQSEEDRRGKQRLGVPEIRREPAGGPDSESGAAPREVRADAFGRSKTPLEIRIDLLEVILQVGPELARFHQRGERRGRRDGLLELAGQPGQGHVILTPFGGQGPPEFGREPEPILLGCHPVEDLEREASEGLLGEGG